MTQKPKIETAITFFQEQLKAIKSKGFASAKFLKFYNARINDLIDEFNGLEDQLEISEQTYKISLGLANDEIRLLKGTRMRLSAICLIHGIEMWQIQPFLSDNELYPEWIENLLRESINQNVFTMPGRYFDAILLLDSGEIPLEKLMEESNRNKLDRNKNNKTGNGKN